MFIFKKTQTQNRQTENNDDAKLPSRKLDEEFDLHEQVDEAKLDAFWEKVETDIANDPDWVKFTS